MSASQGLSKPGWNMPSRASEAVKRYPDTEDVEKSQGDDDSSNSDTGKPSYPETGVPLSEISISDTEAVGPNEQAGVQKVEAITLTWSKKSLRLIYVK